MNQVNISDAQLNFPDLVDATRRGEEFVILLDGKPAAKLTSADATAGRPVFGSARGKVKMSHDFDEPLEDFADYMQ